MKWCDSKVISFISFFVFFFVSFHLVKETNCAITKRVQCQTVMEFMINGFERKPLYFRVLFVFCLVLFFSNKDKLHSNGCATFSFCFSLQRRRESEQEGKRNPLSATCVVRNKTISWASGCMAIVRLFLK